MPYKYGKRRGDFMGGGGGVFMYIFSLVFYEMVDSQRGAEEKHNNLSNRPQVSMGYKLINHAGCW